MVSSIGSNSIQTHPISSGESTSGLHAQIAKDKKELSACINCASATTAEGKFAIAELTSKINAAEARVEQITTRKPDAVQNESVTTNSVSAARQTANSADPGSKPDNNDSSLGRLVDVFA